MKKTVCAIKWVAAICLLVGQTSLAQPWSVSVTSNAPAAPPGGTPLPQFAVTPLPAGILSLDHEQQECILQPGEYTGALVFNVTNISPREVTVTAVQTSCGCTTANLQFPFKIGPGGQTQIPVKMDMRGRSGVIIKTVTLHTDQGHKSLLVKTTMLPGATSMTALDRERNQQLALADPQAVFKGDCARCHVEPVIGKMGRHLYDTACGICHDAEHRASMVPDLHTLKVTPNAEYWRLFITHGKPGTLMPAFAQAKGGPLSETQINSLVDYLVKEFPHSKTNAPGAH